MSVLPVALTVAGSDSGGGAGIQADLKTFFALGCHGTSAITALTAQNTLGVHDVHALPPAFVVGQIDAIVSDLPPRAVKTGMLASASIVEAVAASLGRLRVPIVVDPVSVSAHGHRLLEEDALDALRKLILPLASVLTPNLPEASVMLGRKITDVAGMEDAARALADLGPDSVLVKGGHLDGPSAVDVLYSRGRIEHVTGERFATEDTHGTGCALSAAIAAFLARGATVETAVAEAKVFISGAIRYGLRIGEGFGPVNPGWRLPGAAGYASGSRAVGPGE